MKEQIAMEAVKVVNGSLTLPPPAVDWIGTVGEISFSSRVTP